MLSAGAACKETPRKMQWRMQTVARDQAFSLRLLPCPGPKSQF